MPFLSKIFMSDSFTLAGLVVLLASQAALPAAGENPQEFRNWSVTGLVVVIIVREMFTFLKTRKNGNGKAVAILPATCPLNATIELWEERLTRAIVNGLKESLGQSIIQLLEIEKKIVENQEKLIESSIRIESKVTKGS